MEQTKKKILLIEDDRAYMHALYERLCDEGYYVVTASNAEAAKDWALDKEMKPIDMIIADQKMPGEVGTSFLAFLHELGKTDPEKLDRNSELYKKVRQRFSSLSDTEFLNLLKNIKAPSCIRVILSGYAEDDLTQEALRKGDIHRFVPKKIGHDEIAAAVKELLDQCTSP